MTADWKWLGRLVALVASGFAGVDPLWAEESPPPMTPAKQPEVIQIDLSKLPPELAEKLRQLQPGQDQRRSEGQRPAAGGTGKPPLPPPDAEALAADVPAMRVALLDVGQLFDKHASFQAEMEGMKKEVKAFEIYLRDQQARLTTMAAGAAREEAGSAERQRQEKEIADQSEAVKVETQVKRQEFLKREADAYFRVYREIEAAVAAYAQKNAITLVLRYTNTDLNPTDRDSVLRGINRPIVFRERRLDITEPIVEALNAAKVAAAGQNRPAGN